MPPFVIAVPVIRLPHRHRMRLRFEYSAGKPSLRFARHAVPRCQSAADSSGRGGTGRGPRRPWDPIARMFGLVPDQMDEGPPWMGLTWPDSHFHSPAVLLQLLKSFVVVMSVVILLSFLVHGMNILVRIILVSLKVL